MPRSALIVCLLTALAAHRPPAGHAQPSDPHAAAWARVTEFVHARMRESNTPGLALAITSRERLLHVATFGWATLGGRAVTPDTLFEIGSISKSFTSVALLQLRDEGRFDPAAPITTYLPWFSVRSRFAPITGHHLMTHTAGLPRDRDDVPSSKYQAYALREREIGVAPGVQSKYSNIGYQVLGYTLEAIEKRPYADVIARRILQPLGMRATSAQFTHDTRPRLAVGYVRMFDDRPSHPAHPLVPATWLEYASGDGSIVSTPADMAAYARMLLNRGGGRDGARILSDAGFTALTARAAPVGEQRWYGYGMMTAERDGRTLLSHSGGMVGYASMLAADPDAGVAAVVLVNGPGSAGRVADFALDAARAALRGEPLPELPEPTDPAIVENGAEYAGVYTSGSRTLTLKADPPLLGTPSPHGLMLLEQRGRDTFYLNDSAWHTFLLRFEREGEKVVGFAHGGDWYARDGSRRAVTPHPREWNAYPGHYRATHAWFNNFRIVIRNGALYLIDPSGDETPLEPIGPGLFKERGPSSERLRFDSIVDGEALRANLSGVDYYRVFTP